MITGTTETRKSRYCYGFGWQQSRPQRKSKRTIPSMFYFSHLIKLYLYLLAILFMLVKRKKHHYSIPTRKRKKKKNDVVSFVLYSQDAREYADKNGMFFIETSAKTADNINQLFEVPNYFSVVGFFFSKRIHFLSFLGEYPCGFWYLQKHPFLTFRRNSEEEVTFNK